MPSHRFSSLRQLGRQLKTAVRAGEWWGHKLSPLLATAYATATLADAALAPLLPVLLLQLLALAVGAVYVSLLNDWTDRAIDEAAGKANRLAGRSPLSAYTALGFCVAAGLALGLGFWRLGAVVGLWYGGAWLAYSLYSLPPFRLKVRSFWGVLADAAGAHLCPQLFTVALISHWVAVTIPTGYWWTVGGWSLACGLRNILWHQLSDEAADRRAGVPTFVTQVGARLARRLGERLLFPVEVLLFGFILFYLAQPLPWAALGGYVLLEALRRRVWGQRVFVLAPNQRIALNEYYITFYPIALLVTQLGRHPSDGVVLLGHLLLFGGHVAVSVRALYQLARQAFRGQAR